MLVTASGMMNVVMTENDMLLDRLQNEGMALKKNIHVIGGPIVWRAVENM